MITPLTNSTNCDCYEDDHHHSPHTLFLNPQHAREMSFQKFRTRFCFVCPEKEHQKQAGLYPSSSLKFSGVAQLRISTQLPTAKNKAHATYQPTSGTQQEEDYPLFVSGLCGSVRFLYYMFIFCMSLFIFLLLKTKPGQ